MKKRRIRGEGEGERKRSTVGKRQGEKMGETSRTRKRRTRKRKWKRTKM